MAKLVSESNRSHFPFHTRKMAAEDASLHAAHSPRGARRSNNAAATGFDFTEIFDELSALSREITDALDSKGEAGRDDQAGGLLLEEGVVPLPRDEDAKSAAKDVSLRKMAFKNAAAGGAGKDLPLVLKGAEEQHAGSPSSGNVDSASAGGNNNGSSRASPASNDDGLSVGAAKGDFVGMSVVHSPERLRDIKSLDAKLAAIKFDLEGTEAT